ncbi:hypothetical protein ACJJIF_21975 (plasmid) [Microbulbifer sp. SSSA002]|uniref:hypothetical protein n=1 Tax=Microbulbifer sp. SSSA002 TaxID=3243376 RepID=UPI004039FD79
MEALASDATLLLPLLENNAAGLRDAAQEARDYGVALNEVDSAKLKAAGDAMLRVQQNGQGRNQPAHHPPGPHYRRDRHTAHQRRPGGGRYGCRSE